MRVERDPLRIVSLVPSLTQTLAALGHADSLVGATQFCVDPPGLHRRVTLVGGTKDPNLALIASLSPTHIVTNEEENKPEHIEACAKIATTLRTLPKGPSDVPAMLRDLGSGLGLQASFDAEAELLAADLVRLRDSQRGGGVFERVGRRYLYLIWREPYMVCSVDTYISRLLEAFGFENACRLENRYPALSVDELKSLEPDVLFLATEPYPFRRRDAERLARDWGATAPPMWRLDGRLLSWYGALTRKALAELESWTRGRDQRLAVPFEVTRPL